MNGPRPETPEPWRAAPANPPARRLGYAWRLAHGSGSGLRLPAHQPRVVFIFILSWPAPAAPLRGTKGATRYALHAWARTAFGRATLGPCMARPVVPVIRALSCLPAGRYYVRPVHARRNAAPCRRLMGPRQGRFANQAGQAFAPPAAGRWRWAIELLYGTDERAHLHARLFRFGAAPLQ